MIAIHDCPGSFSDRWIEYCRDSGIKYCLVDIFDDGVIGKLRSIRATALLCHPQMADRKAVLGAKAVLYSCEISGISVFPGFSDFWHFDDKIAQKYLFEALDIETPRTHVFYSAEAAAQWIREATYPAVFKLRAGAGSVNVSLLNSRADADAMARKMFGRGVSSTDAATKDILTKVRNHRRKRDWAAVIRRLPRTVSRWLELRRSIDRERGYFYVQQFIPLNEYDTRVVIIGARALAFRRRVRPGDFRASGSGDIDHDHKSIDVKMIEYAFFVASKLGTRCIAFDFIQDKSDGRPLIVEMSFGFVADIIHECPGYWDKDLEWVEGNTYPQDAIVQDILKDM